MKKETERKIEDLFVSQPAQGIKFMKEKEMLSMLWQYYFTRHKKSKKLLKDQNIILYFANSRRYFWGRPSFSIFCDIVRRGAWPPGPLPPRHCEGLKPRVTKILPLSNTFIPPPLKPWRLCTIPFNVKVQFFIESIYENDLFVIKIPIRWTSGLHWFGNKSMFVMFTS